MTQEVYTWRHTRHAVRPAHATGSVHVRQAHDVRQAHQAADMLPPTGSTPIAEMCENQSPEGAGGQGL